MTQTAPAGWYPDPEDPTKQRYWDGAAWTENVAPTDDRAPVGETPPPEKTSAAPKVALVVGGALTLAVLACGILGALLFSASAPDNPSSNTVQLAAEMDVEPLERTEDANIYTDVETGASFVVPSTWTELPLRVPTKTDKTRFEVSSTVYVMYGSPELWGMLSEDAQRGKTRADYQSMADLANDDILGPSGPDRTVRRMVLNGVEYYATSSAGTAYGEEVRQVMLVRLENGRLYKFSYVAAAAELPGGMDDPSLQTFYSMVASMDFPEY